MRIDVAIGYAAACFSLLNACGGDDAGAGTTSASAVSGAGGSGAGDAGPGTGGADAAGGANGSSTGGASAGVQAYLVIHADPADQTVLPQHWARLEALVAYVDGRSRSLPTPHHLSIMWTAPWGVWLTSSPSGQAALATVGEWMARGHEMAFHSHTHNHAFRDGYSNALDAFGADTPGDCAGSAGLGECTLDFGLGAVRDAMDAAAGSDWPLRFAAIGPNGNGGGYWGFNDDSCVPASADETACIDAEWVGDVATLPAATSDYATLTPESTSDPSALLGASSCAQFGAAPAAVYVLPHAAFETESSKTKVSLATVEAALDRAQPGDLVGLVVHPASYVADPSSFDGDGIAQMNALVAALEARGLASRALSEVQTADDGPGAPCNDLDGSS